MYSVYGWKEISNYAFANAREAYEWQLENIPGFKTGFTASYLLDLTEQFYVSTVSGYVGASVTTIAAPLGPVAPLAGAVAGFISYFAMDTVYRFWLREPIQDILGLLGVKEFEKCLSWAILQITLMNQKFHCQRLVSTKRSIFRKRPLNSTRFLFRKCYRFRYFFLADDYTLDRSFTRWLSISTTNCIG